MKSSEEMRRYLQVLMGWGLDRPSMYGGTPQGADAVFWSWRFIWAQLTERVTDFYGAILACERSDEEPEPKPAAWFQMCSDPAAYSTVVSFWRCVDQRLGIDYPPETEFVPDGIGGK